MTTNECSLTMSNLDSVMNPPPIPMASFDGSSTGGAEDVPSGATKGTCVHFKCTYNLVPLRFESARK